MKNSCKYKLQIALWLSYSYSVKIFKDLLHKLTVFVASVRTLHLCCRLSLREMKINHTHTHRDGGRIKKNDKCRKVVQPHSQVQVLQNNNKNCAVFMSHTPVKLRVLNCQVVASSLTLISKAQTTARKSKLLWFCQSVTEQAIYFYAFYSKN